jgi:hypothetical protein
MAVAVHTHEIAYYPHTFATGVGAFEVASACCVKADIGNAFNVSRHIPTQLRFREHQAIYVLDDGLGATKIGIAGCPYRRIADLQRAAARPLTVRAVFWAYGSVREVEAKAIAEAQSDGFAMKGEWCSRDWFSAAMIVAEAAMHANVPLASSAMWLANRIARYDALDQHDAREVDMRPEVKLGYIEQSYAKLHGPVIVRGLTS